MGKKNTPIEHVELRALADGRRAGGADKPSSRQAEASLSVRAEEYRREEGKLPIGNQPPGLDAVNEGRV
jgi:hypothetical protein